MRTHFLAALLAISLPQGFATPVAAAEAELSTEDLQTYGQWVARALETDAPMHAEFARISPRMAEIMQRVRQPGGAKAAATELSAVIAGIRPVLLKSQADMRALAPIAEPKDSQYPFPTKQLRNDFLATGARIIGVLDSTEGLAKAIAANDRATADRHAAELKQSATLLIDGQVLLVRARRAAIPADESSHQAMGLMETMYQAMGLIMAQKFDRAAWPAAGFTQLATHADRFVATGEQTLAAELREAESATAGNASDRRILAAAKQVLLIEKDTWGLGRELATALKTAATQGRAAEATVMRELVQMEMRFQLISQRQAEAVAGAN